MKILVETFYQTSSIWISWKEKRLIYIKLIFTIFIDLYFSVFL